MTLPEDKVIKVYPAKRQEKVTCLQTYQIQMVNEDAVNFPNEDIEVDWSCMKVVDDLPGTACEAKTTKGLDPYETENLECNAVYTFNLTVYFVRYDSRYTLKSTHQVIYKSVPGPTKITIKCYGNCETTLPSSGTIKLTAVETPETLVPITWKMYSLENGPDGETRKELSDAELSRGRVPDLGDDVFLLQLKFFPKPQYTVVASTKTGEESYTFRVNHGPSKGICSISPTSGEMGRTNFTVTCQNFNRGILPITYRVVEEYPLSTYPIVSSLEEVMQDIILFHTNVSVIITDAAGASSRFFFSSLKLKPCERVTISQFEEFMKQINLKLLGNQNEEALEIMGEIARRMAVSKTPYTDESLLQLLDLLSRVDTFDDAVDVQRGFGILNRVMEGERTPASLRTDEVLLVGAEQFITLSDSTSSMVEREEMSNYDKSMLVPSVLQGASLIMKTKDDVVTGDSLEEDVNERHIQRAKDSTVAVLGSMDKFLQALGDEVNNTFEEYEKNVGGFDMEVAVGKLLSLSDKETTKGNEKSFNFSEEFLKENARSEVTLLKLTTEPKSVFWFMPESSVGLVDIAIQPMKENLSEVFEKEPIIVQMALDNLTTEYFDGILKPAPSCSCTKKDRSVSVLQLKLPDGEGIVIVKIPPKFMNKTKMVFQQGRRPVFDSFNNSSPANQEIVYQPYKNLDNLNESDFYVGLIPDSQLTVPTPYKLEVSIVRCAIWMGEQFESRGCKLQSIDVSSKTDGKRRITCNCTHHSWFSASLFLPPHKIVLADDLQLFSTIFDNFYVALLMFLIILFLVVVLIWGYRKDRRDVADRYIITLEDNWPGETYPYVIAVFTGERLGSGTTSQVALRLWGSRGTSRVHILGSSSRSVLKLGSDSWFLLKTPNPIGTLKSVQLWHNHSGPRPEWYCRRVVVYDIKGGQTYEFLVERWFTFDVSCPVEEARFFHGYVATYEEISRKWYYHITGWAFSELRDKHHWASIFTRHPRSLYTRCQRVMIAVGLLTTTMLVSMMFFDVSVTGPADIPATKFTIEEFWIGLKSTIISIILTTAVLWCFERSKKTALLEIEKLQQAKEEPKVKLPFKKKIKKKLKEMAKNKVAPQPIPYQAVAFGADEKRKKKISVIIFLILGWVISTITLIAVTFFIILYGLKFGVKKSLVWILTFVSGTVSDTFLMEPLKMVVLAVIVSLVFKKSNLENFTMKVKYEPVPESRETKLAKLRKLYHTRLEGCYSPYLTDWIKEFHHSRCSRKVKYLMVYGVFYTLMLILVGLFIYVIDEEVKFFYLRQVGYHFKETKSVRTALFTNESNQVLTKESMYKFFHFTAIPALHRVLWYNNKSLPLEKGEEEPNADEPRFSSKVKGFAQGYTSKLLGVPRLRQMRMRNSDLFLVRVDKLFRLLYPKAIGNYISLKEERRAHLPKWKLYDNSLGKLRQLWTYTKPFDTGTIVGKTLLPYPGGGYFRYLDWNLGGSQRSLQNLEMNNWVDNYTRSIFLEMNLYNNNLKLFATIRLVTEALPCGFYSFRTQLQSASFFFEKNPESKAIVGLMFLLSLLLLGYGIFCFIQFSRIGFFNYMGTFRGFCDIILLVCGVASVANYFQRALHFSLFIEYLDNAPHDKFVSLYTPFQADEAAQNAFGAFTMMLTVSMGVNIVQIISIGRFTWVFSKVFESLTAVLLLNIIFNLLLSYTSITVIRQFFNFFFFQFSFKEERQGNLMDEENRWFFLVCFPLIIVVMQFNVATIVYFYNTLDTMPTTALVLVQLGKQDESNTLPDPRAPKKPKIYGRKRREPMEDPEAENGLQKKIDKLLVF
ncbi:hypothetical protein GE061_002968 [Apolygus lucorum]|uniref:PLAT domain-containing protein n=1 Tax=Apolygus lucorum TaxID=248454 RepID=A0A8S9X070_APOLU|nr:hypothetical protein GE061_002968 [Apolygus lucorum]